MKCVIPSAVVTAPAAAAADIYRGDGKKGECERVAIGSRKGFLFYLFISQTSHARVVAAKRPVGRPRASYRTTRQSNSPPSVSVMGMLW